jgi:predicted nucleotidyltransferase
MVESRSQIKKIVARYREELTKAGIRIAAIYLYGSYAHGLAHERLELLGIVSARILEPIQAYGLTPEEVEKHELNSFWSNILSYDAELV